MKRIWNKTESPYASVSGSLLPDCKITEIHFFFSFRKIWTFFLYQDLDIERSRFFSCQELETKRPASICWAQNWKLRDFVPFSGTFSVWMKISTCSVATYRNLPEIPKFITIMTMPRSFASVVASCLGICYLFDSRISNCFSASETWIFFMVPYFKFLLKI